MRTKEERRARHSAKLKTRRVRDTAVSTAANKDEIIQSQGKVYIKTSIDGVKFFTKLSIDKD
tara:strand:+ start:296 stop:481 length:186 start_codon:yes stop_codon:yes gene_type:complete